MTRSRQKEAPSSSALVLYMIRQVQVSSNCCCFSRPHWSGLNRAARMAGIRQSVRVTSSPSSATTVTVDALENQSSPKTNVEPTEALQSPPFRAPGPRLTCQQRRGVSGVLPQNQLVAQQHQLTPGLQRQLQLPDLRLLTTKKHHYHQNTLGVLHSYHGGGQGQAIVQGRGAEMRALHLGAQVALRTQVNQTF